MAEGALTSRSAGTPHSEPSAPEHGGHTHESACLNCGTPLIGPHCHACGQHAHVHRTIGAFLHDLLHGALHFEGKTCHTLPLLLTRPGELTRRYIAGERARFVSPMALFLFCVFLMFAAFQIAGISAAGLSAPTIVAPEELTSAQEDVLSRRAQLQERLSTMPAGDPRRAALEEEAAELNAASAQITALESIFTSNDAAQTGREEVHTGWTFLDKGIAKFRENPALMLYKLQANSYKFSWLLIPLSIPFVALLFAWRGRFGAYDHAVFVTYSLSFMTLLFVALTLLDRAGLSSGLTTLAALLIPPVHIYRQMKGAYQLRRFSALWRTAALLMFISIILLVFLNLLLMLGTFG